jgi:hypothetical protein
MVLADTELFDFEQSSAKSFIFEAQSNFLKPALLASLSKL